VAGRELGERAAKEATGEVHHLISKKIERALATHPTLAGKLTRVDARLQYIAADAAAHRGYQAWHRAVDDEVVRWLTDPANIKASRQDFAEFLEELYKRPDIQQRIPGVDLSAVGRDIEELLQ